MAYIGDSVMPRKFVDHKSGSYKYTDPFPTSGTIKQIQFYSREVNAFKLQLIRGTREVSTVNIKSTGLEKGANVVSSFSIINISTLKNASLREDI